MNKQQTTLEWFAFELSKLGLLPDGVPDEIYKQAKEMEKEKLKDSWVEGSIHWGTNKTFEQYYNETYGGNK
jgi:hypothetical protein